MKVRALRLGATAVVATLALVLMAPLAHADDGARNREREALYKQGVNLAAAGNWAEAVQRFRRVVELRPSPKALYTLGEAEEHAGQLAGAKQSYRSSLDAARAARLQDVINLAGTALGKLEGRVPQVTVVLDDRTAAHGGTLHTTLDGQSVAVGAPTDVDPGDHEVRVEAAGANPFVRTVHAAEGQQQSIQASLRWVESAPTPPPDATPPPSAQEHGVSPLVPIVIGGVGLAAGVVGLVVRLKGQSDYDTASSQCSGTVCPTSGAANAGNDARGRMILGTTLLGVGAAVAVGAGVYWAVSSRSAHPVEVGAVLDETALRTVLRGTF